MEILYAGKHAPITFRLIGRYEFFYHHFVKGRLSQNFFKRHKMKSEKFLVSQRMVSFVIDRADGGLKLLVAPKTVLTQMQRLMEDVPILYTINDMDWTIEKSGVRLQTRYTVSRHDVISLTSQERTLAELNLTNVKIEQVLLRKIEIEIKKVSVGMKTNRSDILDID